MCLAIPSKIIRIENSMATIDHYGARREVSLLLMPEEVNEGDYVLVHAGFAIQRVEADAANDALALIRQIIEQAETEDSTY